MAAGWSVMDALNRNSKAAAEDKPRARFRTKDISIRKMYSNDRNFYKTTNHTCQRSLHSRNHNNYFRVGYSIHPSK